MTDIEIPYPEDRKGLYRWLERAPILLSVSVLLIPITLSLINSFLAGLFVIAFVVVWFVRSVITAFRVTQGYNRVKEATRLDWNKFLKDVDRAEEVIKNPPKDANRVTRDHYRHLRTYLDSDKTRLKSKDVIHALFVATYNESYDVLEPTIQSVIDSNFDVKNQVVLIFAYEERGGERTRENVKKLIEKFGDEFLYAEAIGHPDGIKGEVQGKGGNITYAGRKFNKWLDKNDIDRERVILTTLDADNRPHPQYLAAMSYSFITAKRRKYKSFQPAIIYTNNVWDVPAPSRVIAMANTFWTVTQSLRPHMLRNFSSHAQPMQGVVDSDYWSVRTVVEDGHQFWRTYFTYDGEHDVIPVFVPIYQDAVLAEGYRRTVRAQFFQLRRWAWGCSDIAYITTKGFFTPNKVPKMDMLFKWARLVDTHISWATASLLIAFAAWAPLLLSAEGSDDIIAQQLPGFVSRISTIMMTGIVIALYMTFRFLPGRPDHHGKFGYVRMVLQWILVPILSIAYGSLTAVNAQTRLFLGKYLGFDVTEKAVKKAGDKEAKA